MRISVRAIVIKDNKLLVMDRNRFGDKFISLVGGAVEIGESQESALKREVSEEASLEIANPKLVIIEEAGEIYGLQYIYLCDYVSGDPKLSEGSIESKIARNGQNLYLPMWLDIKDLELSNLLPVELKKQLIDFIKNGFPSEPIKLTITKDSKV